jgi:hypothetical protein
MKLATLAFLALSTLGVMMAGPLADAGLLPAQPSAPMFEGNDDDGDGQTPPDDPCACHPSITLNRQDDAGIRAYWTGWDIAGRCMNDACPEASAACHWAGMFTVQNVGTVPKTIHALPGHPGTAGNGPHVLMPGQWVDKPGVTATADCGDQDFDDLIVNDNGPNGQKRTLTVYFNCSSCDAD